MSPFIYVLTTNGLLFLLSLIFWKFPPKNINRIYGYRTHKSMLNSTIWKFANSVFNKHFIIYSGISLIAGLVLANFTTSEMTWEPMILVILTIVVCIIKTERALSDTFTEEGKKK
jgi:uncharacterized membrane protein